MNEEIELTADLFEPLSDDEKNREFIAADSKTYFQDAWARFKKNKMALIGLGFLAVMVVLAILVPMLSPFEYDGMDLTDAAKNAEQFVRRCIAGTKESTPHGVEFEEILPWLWEQL